MATPDDRKYSKEHEWALLDGDAVTVGITEFATQSLGDVVFVDLPEVGAIVTQYDKFGEVESVKAVSDLFCPVGGTVLERNDALLDTPEIVNQESYGSGWFVKLAIGDPSEMDALMTAAEYDAFTAAQE